MSNVHLIFIIATVTCWIFVTAYWIVSFRKTSLNHKGNEISSFLKLILSTLIIYLPLLTGTALATPLFSTSIATELAGTLFCVSGVSIMIWARENLGKNWSGNVILQQEHSITKTGPYQYVRHPIYGGGLLGMFGSAIVTAQIFGFAWVLFCAFGLIMKMKKEEELLSAQFPREYPLYRKQTKMLIPFVW